MCPLLVDVSVCVGGGPLIKLFVMGCLWCFAERGCGGGVVQMGKVCWVWVFADLGAPLREPMCQCVCLGDL